MAAPRAPREWLRSASRLQQEADDSGLGEPKPAAPVPVQRSLIDRFDEAITSSALRTASRRLFADGHYARAVQAALTRLNNAVKSKSGLTTADGDSLMRHAFSATNPILRFNALKNTTDTDEQRGYMDLYAGVMTGVRNPRVHDHELEDEPNSALELLTLANHLMHKLDGTKKTRRPQRTKR